MSCWWPYTPLDITVHQNWTHSLTASRASVRRRRGCRQFGTLGVRRTYVMRCCVSAGTRGAPLCAFVTWKSPSVSRAVRPCSSTHTLPCAVQFGELATDQITYFGVSFYDRTLWMESNFWIETNGLVYELWGQNEKESMAVRILSTATGYWPFKAQRSLYVPQA